MNCVTKLIKVEQNKSICDRLIIVPISIMLPLFAIGANPRQNACPCQVSALILSKIQTVEEEEAEEEEEGGTSGRSVGSIVFSSTP